LHQKKNDIFLSPRSESGHYLDKDRFCASVDEMTDAAILDWRASGFSDGGACALLQYPREPGRLPQGRN
jgi:hypothetical protein